MNAVAMRVAPPRSGTGTQKPAAPAAKADTAPQEDTRSTMQKLMDRFK